MKVYPRKAMTIVLKDGMNRLISWRKTSSNGDDQWLVVSRNTYSPLAIYHSPINKPSPYYERHFRSRLLSRERSYLTCVIIFPATLFLSLFRTEGHHRSNSH